MASDQALYNHIIIDHYHAPRNRGVLKNPDIDIRRSNESCGDMIHLTASLQNGIITAIKCEGDGCIISQAYASLLTEAVMHQSIDFVKAMDETAFIALAHLQLGPQRALCAVFSLRTLKEALQKYHA